MKWRTLRRFLNRDRKTVRHSSEGRRDTWFRGCFPLGVLEGRPGVSVKSPVVSASLIREDEAVEYCRRCSGSSTRVT